MGEVGRGHKMTAHFFEMMRNADFILVLFRFSHHFNYYLLVFINFEP